MRLRLTDLPEPCQEAVLDFLGQDDRLRARLVCRAWANAPLRRLTGLGNMAGTLVLLSRPGLCSQLEELDIETDPLDLDVASVVATAAVHATRLQRLCIHAPETPPPGTAAMAQTMAAALRGLQKLDLSTVNGPVDISPLGTLPMLSNLDIQLFTEDGPVRFLPPGPVPSLEYLSIQIVNAREHVCRLPFDWRALPNLCSLVITSEERAGVCFPANHPLVLPQGLAHLVLDFPLAAEPSHVVLLNEYNSLQTLSCVFEPPMAIRLLSCCPCLRDLTMWMFDEQWEGHPGAGGIIDAVPSTLHSFTLKHFSGGWHKPPLLSKRGIRLLRRRMPPGCQINVDAW